MIWHLGRSSIFDVFDKKMRTLLEFLKFDGFPCSQVVCEKFANEFALSRSTANLLYGCVGALYIVAICIRKPVATDKKIRRGTFIEKDATLL